MELRNSINASSVPTCCAFLVATYMCHKALDDKSLGEKKKKSLGEVNDSHFIFSLYYTREKSESGAVQHEWDYLCLFQMK